MSSTRVLNPSDYMIFKQLRLIVEQGGALTYEDFLMTSPFELFQKSDTPAATSDSARQACCAEVWGPPAPEKTDPPRQDKAETPPPIESKDLLKSSGAPVTPHEAAHYKSLSPKEIDQVRRTFDSLGLDKTKLSPETISTVSRNLVKALGSDDYEQREYASKALKDMGIAALPALVDAKLSSTDLEQRKRVDRLVQPFSNGSGQDVAAEQQRILKYEQDRKDVRQQLGGGPNGETPLQQEMRMQKDIVNAPDSKLSPNLTRLEKLVDSSKVHLLSGKADKERGAPVDKELVAERAGKFKSEIDGVKKMADETAAKKAAVKLALAGNLLGQNFNADKIPLADRNMAAKLVMESLKDPKILGQQKSDFFVRQAIADLKHLKHPAAGVKQLEDAYSKAGGDPKKLAQTTHRYASDIQQLKNR